MHHSSWLFPGACKVHTQTNDSSASRDPSSNSTKDKSNVSPAFGINSFVRSFNRNGIQLPEGFIFKCTSLKKDENNNSNNKAKKRESPDSNARKSLNDFLNNLNDSVDRVVGWDAKDGSNSSSFASFRSSNEDKDSTAWNDLINLVSVTAHEFREINNSANVEPRIIAPESCNEISDIDRKKLLPRNTRASNDDSRLLKLVERKISRLDVTPTNDDSREPQLVNIYSDSSNDEGARPSEERSRTIGHLKVPKGLVGETLGATRNSSDRNSWITPNGRINFDDDTWSFGRNCGHDFTPYFTGRPSRQFGFRGSIEKDPWNDPTRRFTNVSRSWPICIDAGEAIAETLAEPTRDDCHKRLYHEENSLDARPTKLLEKMVSDAEDESEASSENYSTKSPDIPENGKKSLSESCKNDDYNDGKKTRVRAKLLVKRGRKVRKQTSKKNGRKFPTKMEDEDSRNQGLNSIIQSPLTSGRRTPMQRFFDDSCRMRENDDDEISAARDEDSIETQVGIASKIQTPERIPDNLMGKRSRNVARTSGILISQKNRKDHYYSSAKGHYSNVNEERSSNAIDRSCVGSKRLAADGKYVGDSKERSNRCEKPIWKPGGSIVKVASSTSVSSMPRRSRIAQLIRSGTNNISAATSGKSQTPVIQTRAMKQRPLTSEKLSKTQISENSEAKPRLRTTELLDNRVISMERKKILTNKETTRVPSLNSKTTIPVLRSKTFVHQTRPDSSVRRILSKEDYSRSIDESGGSTRISRNPSTSGATKQSFRKSSKNLFHPSARVDSSSDTNFHDTPLDSRVNTDTELSHSVSLVSNSIAKNAASNVGSNNSVVVVTGAKVDAINIESAIEKSKFQNKHARSLRMLKSILSYQGVNVESINKDATEIRSRILNDSAKKLSQVPISTGGKKSFAMKDENLGKTSRTLFEKLAILAESQPERLERADTDARESFGQLSSFMDLASDSITSWPKSTRDAGDQCSIECDSSMVSRTSIHSEKSSCSDNLQQHTETNFVDAAVSPLPSVADFSPRLESTKYLEIAETQTQSNAVDKDSITDETSNRSVVNASTETDVITSIATKEACTDCCEREYKVSRDAASGKDFSDIPSISRAVNTQSSDIFVKSRGVCFRGPRKIDGGTWMSPFENSVETASGKDYVESQGISEHVNTDRQDYLYVDRSVDRMGPETRDDACQIEPRSGIIDVAVGESCQDASRDFCKIELVKNPDVGQSQSWRSFDAPRREHESACSSSSSLIVWRGSCADKFPSSIDRVPREAIVALEMARERAQNLYKAIGIYRENLATGIMRNEQGSTEVYLSNTNGERNEKSGRSCSIQSFTFRDNSMIKSLLKANMEKSLRCSEISNHSSSADLPPDDSKFSNLREELTIVMDNILTNVIRKIEKEHEYVKCQDDGKNSIARENFLPSKRIENPCSEIGAIVQDTRNTREENFASTKEKTLQFSLLSRNSLLTFVYGTVCSLVFWALQFSITCDSL